MALIYNAKARYTRKASKIIPYTLMKDSLAYELSFVAMLSGESFTKMDCICFGTTAQLTAKLQKKISTAIIVDYT